jgi:hypothetical protein
MFSPVRKLVGGESESGEDRRGEERYALGMIDWFGRVETYTR